jgi:hypothetical protein
MLIKTTYKYFHIFYFTCLGLFLLSLTFSQSYIWSFIIFVPVALLLWVMIKRPVVHTLGIQDHTMTITYTSYFRMKTVQYPLSALRFDLDSSNFSGRFLIKKYTLQIYENDKRIWYLTSGEGGFTPQELINLVNYVSRS